MLIKSYFVFLHLFEMQSSVTWCVKYVFNWGVCRWISVKHTTDHDLEHIHKHRPLVTLVDIQCFIHKSKYTIHLVQTKICSSRITFFVSMCDIVSLNLLDCTLAEIRYTGTQIPDLPVSSLGPSRDYGMSLCLEVYLWTIYPYFTTFGVTTLSFY